jgi:oxazoline/thiazoline synthase
MVIAVPDVTSSPMKIVVPLPPFGVNCVGQLDNYLDMPFAVARVFGPGLRPHWPRFAPGRLYDVPHALGWANPLTEDLLNPQFLMY